MAKKKTKAREAALDEELGGITKQLTMLQIKAPSATQKQKKVDVREQWDAYFGPGDLEDFQRLCEDLQIEGDLSSKTKCRKALGKVHVNIRQFLNAMDTGTPVMFFRNVHELSAYTTGNRKKRMFPRSDIPKGSPLQKLLRMMG